MRDDRPIRPEQHRAIGKAAIRQRHGQRTDMDMDAILPRQFADTPQLRVIVIGRGGGDETRAVFRKDHGDFRRQHIARARCGCLGQQRLQRFHIGLRIGPRAQLDGSYLHALFLAGQQGIEPATTV